MDEPHLLEIVEGCLRHSAAHQKQLYQLCFVRMMKICLRYAQNVDDAAACYNEAMRKVFLKISQCRNAGSIMGWIKAIVVNTCITQAKQRSRFEKRHKPLTVEEDMTAFTLPDLSANDIVQCVQQLPPTYSLVFNLYVVEGYSHEEIGQLLKIASGTSKWYLSEARSKLKKLLNNVIAQKRSYTAG